MTKNIHRFSLFSPLALQLSVVFLGFLSFITKLFFQNISNNIFTVGSRQHGALHCASSTKEFINYEIHTPCSRKNAHTANTGAFILGHCV